jgi:predicted RNA-binding protein associated with RNAse of E/G family
VGLEIRYHNAMPNWAKLVGLKIRAVPECEGGGFMIDKEQAEAIMSAKLITQDQLDLAVTAAAQHIAPCGHNELGDIYDAVLSAFKAIGVTVSDQPST